MPVFTNFLLSAVTIPLICEIQYTHVATCNEKMPFLNQPYNWNVIFVIENTHNLKILASIKEI